MTRAAVLRKLLVQPRSFLFDQMNQPNRGRAESDKSFDLMARVGHINKDLAGVDSDAAAVKLELDRVRPILMELRQYALRNHLTLARPFWGWPDIQPNPNALAYVGSDDLVPALRAFCKSRKLALTLKGDGWGSGQQRWAQLRQAPVAVFDLRESASQCPATAYALGCALALGHAPVVLASDSDPLPFNIDLEPVDPADDAALADALDRAYFRLESTSGPGSVQETLRQLAKVARGDDATTRVGLRRINQSERLDPIEARALALMILNVTVQHERAVLTPNWPGFYPDPERPRSFHVMPFSESWSDGAREAVRLAWQNRDIQYDRGDENGADRVIRGIWEGIARSHYVLVDVTGLNINVCLELGLSHALGRPTLIVRRQGESDTLFPAIQKLQVPEYTDETITGIIDNFLARQRPPAD